MQYHRLAWRNVWRNRRRSLITISAVLFSMLIIVLTRSLQYGTYDAMESQAVRLFTGEMQIHRTGYHDERTFAYALSESETEWLLALEDAEWLRGSTRRLTGFGLVSGEETSAGAMVLGVEPESETTVSEFMRDVVEGEGLDPGVPNQALLGDVLASNLAASVGDTLVVLTQGFRSQMGADLYRVTGLINTGSIEFDRSLMVISLADAQSLFSMQGQFTEVVLATDDFRRAPGYAERLEADLSADVYDVMDWDELMPELRQMIVLDNVSGAIFLLFMLILVGFEIFNTTTTAIMEREWEFGVLQAMGMKPAQLARLVVTELTLKLGLALLISMVASGLLIWYLEGNPIPLTAEMTEMYEQFDFNVEALMFSTRKGVFLEPLVSIAAIAVAATIYPVVRTYRLETVRALRRGL